MIRLIQIKDLLLIFFGFDKKSTKEGNFESIYFIKRDFEIDKSSFKSSFIFFYEFI